MKLILLALFTVYSLPFTASAAFDDTGTGARATALGGAFVAADGDVQSIMVNPAGLASVRSKEITTEYGQLFAGLSDGSKLTQSFVGYGQPIRTGGTLAAGWKQFKLDDLYSERILSLGYGEWITPRVAAGITLKQLHHSFGVPSISVDDSGNVQNQSPAFFARNGNSNSAYSADLGFLIRVSPRNTVGIAIQDFNEPNVALSKSDREIVSKTMRLGLDYAGRSDLHLMAGLSSRERLANQRDTVWTGAAEKWWRTSATNAWVARGSLSAGSRAFRQVAMGGGYRFNALLLDYTFVFNIGGINLGDTAGTHRFSMGYRFGQNQDALAMKQITTPRIQKQLTPEQQAVRDAEMEELIASQKKTQAAMAPPSETVSRYQLLVRAQQMSTDYAVRTERKASAENRLGALESLLPTLNAYVRSSGIEVSELIAQTDLLDTASREYEAMKWEGASAQLKLAHLVKASETWLIPALRARVWDATDGRDTLYREWLEQALREHAALVNAGATPETRLDSMRRMLSRAIDFENQPRQPIAVPTPTAPIAPPAPTSPVVAPVPAPIPAVKPVKPVTAPKPTLVTKPMPTRESVPAVYLTKEGDTLISLAVRFYGDSKMWREIYILNQDRLGRGGVLTAGQRLIMPERKK